MLHLGLTVAMSESEILALGPPQRPSDFEDPDKLRDYLQALNDYIAVAGRPRFGRRSHAKRSDYEKFRRLQQAGVYDDNEDS